MFAKVNTNTMPSEEAFNTSETLHNYLVAPFLKPTEFLYLERNLNK